MDVQGYIDPQSYTRFTRTADAFMAQHCLTQTSKRDTTSPRRLLFIGPYPVESRSILEIASFASIHYFKREDGFGQRYS